MSINELFAEQKKQDVRKNLIGTLKFGAVAMPLLLIFSVPHYFKANAQVPIYDQDCRSAPTVSTAQSSSIPCYYETATGQLKNYYSGHLGDNHDQVILLNFPDGQTAKMDVSRKSGADWTHAQADGSCWAEVWHGQITAVVRPGARILAIRNPNLEGGTLALNIYIVFPGMLTLVFWTYLFILWKRGDLFKDITKISTNNKD